MTTPTYAAIWNTLSTIDVTEYVKSRGVGSRTLSWIPWSDCLAILQAHYPDFEYEFFPVVFYPDGSAEVGCEVTIGDVSRRVDLPVMDHKFDAVSNPSSRDINDGRWRSFTKSCAVFGLGFQLYRDGSGIPVPIKTKAKATKPTKPTTTEDESKHLESRLAVLEAILIACQEHGGVDVKTQALGESVMAARGPLDRVEKAIVFLQREVLGHV